MCSSSPCLYGATCTNILNGYSCACSAYFTGQRCEIPLGKSTYSQVKTTTTQPVYNLPPLRKNQRIFPRGGGGGGSVHRLLQLSLERNHLHYNAFVELYTTRFSSSCIIQSKELGCRNYTVAFGFINYTGFGCTVYLVSSSKRCCTSANIVASLPTVFILHQLFNAVNNSQNVTFNINRFRMQLLHSEQRSRPWRVSPTSWLDQM